MIIANYTTTPHLKEHESHPSRKRYESAVKGCIPITIAQSAGLYTLQLHNVSVAILENPPFDQVYIRRPFSFQEIAPLPRTSHYSSYPKNTTVMVKSSLAKLALFLKPQEETNR